ncbi:MAG: helix-turn-helix transcriptional regulator [Cyclobacteriaceae bacterium]
MQRLERLSAILIQLQSKKVVRAQEVADRFDISLRTVYRDLKALEVAGVPLGSEAGVGYFLADGYHLPPVMFTPEEAQALLISGKLASAFTDQSVDTHFREALFKIQSVLKAEDKERIETLTDSIKVMDQYRPPLPEGQNLTLVQRALAEKKSLFLQYRSKNKDEVTERTVDPIGLSHYGLGWHLIAFCQLRNGYRDFRLARIQQLDIAGPIQQSDDKISLEDYFGQLSRTNSLLQATVRFDRSIAAYLEDQKYIMGLVSEKITNKYIELTFLTIGLDMLARWLLMYGSAVEVRTPIELTDILKKLSKELAEHYDSED